MHIATLLPLLAALALPAAGAPHAPRQAGDLDIAIGVGDGLVHDPVGALPRPRQLGAAVEGLLNAVDEAANAALVGTPPHRRQASEVTDHLIDTLNAVATDATVGRGAPQLPRPRQLDDATSDLVDGLGETVDDILIGEARLPRQLDEAIDDLLEGLGDVTVGYPCPGSKELGCEAGGPVAHVRRGLREALKGIQGLVNNVVKNAAVGKHRRQLDDAASELLEGISETLDDLLVGDGDGGTLPPPRRQLDDAGTELLEGVTEVDELLVGDGDDGTLPPPRRQLDDAGTELLEGVTEVDELLVGDGDDGTLPPPRRQLDDAGTELLEGVTEVDELLVGDGDDGTLPPPRRQIDDATSDLLAAISHTLDNLLTGPAAPPRRRQLDDALSHLLEGLSQAIDNLLTGQDDAGATPPSPTPGPADRRQLGAALDDLLKDLQQVVEDLLTGQGNGAPATGGGATSPQRRQLDDALSHLLEDLSQTLDDLLTGPPTPPHRRQLDDALVDLLHALDQALDDLLGHGVPGGIQNPERRQLGAAVNGVITGLDRSVLDAIGRPPTPPPSPPRRQLAPAVSELVSGADRAVLGVLGAPPPVPTTRPPAEQPEARQLAGAGAEAHVLDLLRTCISASLGRRQLVELGAGLHVLDLLHVCIGVALGERPSRRQLDVEADVDADVGIWYRRQLGLPPAGDILPGGLTKLPVGKPPVGQPRVPVKPSLPATPTVPGQLPSLVVPLPKLPPLPNHRRSPPPAEPVTGAAPLVEAGLAAQLGTIADLTAQAGAALRGGGGARLPAADAERRQLDLGLNLDVGGSPCASAHFTAQLAALTATLASHGAGAFASLVLGALSQTADGCAAVLPLVHAQTILAPQDSGCTPALVARFAADPSLLLHYYTPFVAIHAADFEREAGPTASNAFPLADGERVAMWHAGPQLCLAHLSTGDQAAVLRAEVTATGSLLILENAWGLPAA